METYISLLRGINVSGKNKIKMVDLRALYENIGLKEVQSYIQSGNLVFKSKHNRKELEKLIQQSILDMYGYNVPVLVLQNEKIQYALENNPFLNEEREEDIKFLAFTFLSEIPSKDKVADLGNYQHNNDEFHIDKDIIFIFAPGGFGVTKFSNNFFEKKLKVSATTRNWKTTHKLNTMTSLK